MLVSWGYYLWLGFQTDLTGWVVESRVTYRVEAEAYGLSSNYTLVMFDEKQRFSESAQDWQTQVKGKRFTQTVD